MKYKGVDYPKGTLILAPKDPSKKTIIMTPKPYVPKVRTYEAGARLVQGKIKGLIDV